MLGNPAIWPQCASGLFPPKHQTVRLQNLIIPINQRKSVEQIRIIFYSRANRVGWNPLREKPGQIKVLWHNLYSKLFELGEHQLLSSSAFLFFRSKNYSRIVNIHDSGKKLQRNNRFRHEIRNLFRCQKRHKQDIIKQETYTREEVD